jgi:hypothetical protein
LERRPFRNGTQHLGAASARDGRRESRFRLCGRAVVHAARAAVLVACPAASQASASAGDSQKEAPRPDRLRGGSNRRAHALRIDARHAAARPGADRPRPLRPAPRPGRGDGDEVAERPGMTASPTARPPQRTRRAYVGRVGTLAFAGPGSIRVRTRKPIMDSKLDRLPAGVWGWDPLPSSCARHAGERAIAGCRGFGRTRCRRARAAAGARSSESGTTFGTWSAPGASRCEVGPRSGDGHRSQEEKGGGKSPLGIDAQRLRCGPAGA